METRLNERQLFALLLIAVGTLWLMFVTGFVPRAAQGALLAFWPLLAIGIGLDLATRKRVVFGLPYSVVAAAVLLLLALVGPIFGVRGGIVSERFREPVGDTEAVKLELDLGRAPTRLAALADDTTLFSAAIEDAAGVRYHVRGDREKTITLADRNGFRPSVGPTSWELGLSPTVPTRLEVDGGSGPARLDLSRLQLDGIRYEGGSGPTTLTLPATGSRYPTDVELGSGAARIAVSNGAALVLDAETGSGSSEWSFGRDTDASFTLDSGSGSVIVDVPDDAPVLVRVQDDGSGTLSLPGFLTRESGHGEVGVWRSASYRDDQEGIVLVIEKAGSGSISVR